MVEESTSRNLEQQIQLGKTKVLEGHTNNVYSVVVKDNLIISSSWDHTIRIWDMNTWECLKVLEGHTDWIRTVFVKDNLIISGSDDATIRITPITLFPGELEVFQSVIDEYWLARNIEKELLGYIGC